MGVKIAMSMLLYLLAIIITVVAKQKLHSFYLSGLSARYINSTSVTFEHISIFLSLLGVIFAGLVRCSWALAKNRRNVGYLVEDLLVDCFNSDSRGAFVSCV